jgi:DNA invertase Pin-like site-specific DNA recombinase
MLAEFQEIESGKSHTNRPQLTAAMELCRKQKATLVIAKLDRLARDVHFILRANEVRRRVCGRGYAPCEPVDRSYPCSGCRT